MVTALDSTETTANDSRVRPRTITRIFEMVTVSVVLGIAAFGTVGLVAAMLGRDRPAIVLPVGALCWLLLIWLWRPDQLSSAGKHLSTAASGQPVRTWVVVAGLLVIAASTLISLLFHGQYVLTNRDPGIYSNGGAWLAQHGSLVVDSRDGVLAGLKNLQANALGQQSLAGDDTRLEIQGAHLFPVLLAFGYWVAGAHGLFAAPAILGAVALAVVFLVGLRFLPDWVALSVLTALAVNFAWIYTVRSVLSEPLLMGFAFAGLLFTLQALVDHSARRLFVAGLVVAVSLLIRADAGVAVLLLLPSTAFLIARAHRRSAGALRNPWLSVGLYAAGWVLPSVLAWIDLNIFSPYYVFFHKSELTLVQAGLVAGVLLSVVVLAVSAAGSKGTNMLMHRVNGVWAGRRALIAFLAAGFVLALAAFAWWIRPLLGEHLTVLGGQGKGSMEVIQKRDGLPLSGDRTYDEISIAEVVWYTGPAIFTGAVLGVAVFLRRFVLGRLHQELILLIALVVPISVLYLYRPSIYPDQPWAIRRFLPVTIPGLLLLAALWAVWLFGRVRADSVLGRPWYRRGAAAALVAVLVLPPLLVSWPLRAVRWEAGGIDGIERVCAEIGSDGVAILSQDIGPVILPAVRGFCAPGVASAMLRAKTAAGALDATSLSRRAKLAGRRLTIVSSSSKAVLLLAPTAVNVHPITLLNTTEVVSTLERAPSLTSKLTIVLWVGQVPA